MYFMIYDRNSNSNKGNGEMKWASGKNGNSKLATGKMCTGKNSNCWLTGQVNPSIEFNTAGKRHHKM